MTAFAKKSPELLPDILGFGNALEQTYLDA
jgi:hypothetical protein